MKEELISFETAKLANKKGFIEWTKDRYTKKGIIQKPENQGWSISAPTQSLLQDWLRVVHNLEVLSMHADDFASWYKYRIRRLSKLGAGIVKVEVQFESYEEALEKGLQEALKLLKQ